MFICVSVSRVGVGCRYTSENGDDRWWSRWSGSRILAALFQPEPSHPMVSSPLRVINLLTTPNLSQTKGEIRTSDDSWL